jgi:hypothetical protein
MWFTRHIVIGIAASLFWFYLFRDFQSTILFFVSSVAIDIDHPISMAILDRTINPFKLFDTLKEINYNGLKRYEEKLFCVFHTVEFMAVLAVLSLYFSILIPILFGVVFHVITDIITVGRNKNKRIFFSTFFLLKYLRGGYKDFNK